VQLDEFYPMRPTHKNSFTHYVRSLYFPLLNLKPENILTMDLFEAGVLSEAEYDIFEQVITFDH
jgi:6-phosphogluconolactonase/glucosamine-6-phosphate isomerase/deaminase